MTIRDFDNEKCPKIKQITKVFSKYVDTTYVRKERKLFCIGKEASWSNQELEIVNKKRHFSSHVCKERERRFYAKTKTSKLRHSPDTPMTSLLRKEPFLQRHFRFQDRGRTDQMSWNHLRLRCCRAKSCCDRLSHYIKDYLYRGITIAQEAGIP